MSQAHDLPYIVGLDIGGTNMVGAVVASHDAQVLSRLSVPTEAARGPEDGLRRIGDLVDQVIATAHLTLAQISGIGIGCTGPVDTPTGRVQNPYTLPTWDDLPLVDSLIERFHLPTLLIGDCDVAALGEHWVGAGKDCANMLYLTFGTGIGGGIISGGRLHRGVGLMSSELGHMVLDLNGPPCYCGARGCFETLAAGPAIARFAAERAAPGSLLLELAGGSRERITAQTVSQAAERGDPVAAELIHQTAFYIGVGLGNLMNILAPEVVVLGGGVMQSWPLFEPIVMETLTARNRMIPFERIAIRAAHLKLNAGVTGAARALLEHLQGRL